MNFAIGNSRNSSFELLRILSQIYIVLYHFCSIWNANNLNQDRFFTSIVIPLHIGVVVFVLISGYFTIKATSKGLIKLLGIFLVYRLIELAGGALQHGISFKDVLVLTRSHWWFINVYLCLFLVSPLLNLWLNKASEKQRWYMMVAFFFAASYMAMGGVKSMANGKNLVNFILFYLVGNQLYYYKDKWISISTKKVALVYVLFNLLLFIASYYLYGTKGQGIINMMCFKYSSPLLLLNAILFFILVGKLNFHSNFTAVQRKILRHDLN